MIGHILLLAAALSAGNAEFDRTAAEGAARIAVGRLRRELTDKGPAQGFLKEAMLADPGAYASRDEAEKSCRSLYSARAEKEFADACQEIRRRLALPENVAFALTDDDKAKLASRFPAAFETERREAVSEQAKGIVREIRPDEAEFESHPEDRLRAVMTQLVIEGQSQPVFEENRQYVSEQIVDPMIAGAKAERRRQREYLMRAKCEAFAPIRLADELKAKLSENVTDRKAKEKDAYKVWGVFPSVLTEALPAAVERRTLDRLVGSVEARAIEVTVDDVASVILRDPAAHVKAKESEGAFAGIYAKEILDKSLQTALEEAPERERDELKAYLSERTSAEPVVKAVERTIRRDVMPKWKAAREEVSARQAAELWPALVEGRWFPSAELADATAARSDYAEAVEKWRSIAELRQMANAGEGRSVLEETGVRADRQVVAAFDRARNAIAAQNAIVDRQHPILLAAFKADGSKPRLATIVECLTKATRSGWDESRVVTLWPDGQLPENADVQHRDLFPSVVRKIELLAKSILEELNQPVPEEKKPEEPPPEEKPEEPAPEQPPEEELEFTISVSRKGDVVEVKLLQGETPVYEKTLGTELAPFGSAMREVADKLGRDLLKLR